MDKVTLNKLIKLNIESTEAARKEINDILLYELVQSSSNKKSKSIMSAVKSYLKSAELSRPVLGHIQHTQNGEQMICNGFSLIIYKKYIPELDAFTQEPRNNSLNAEPIISDLRYKGRPMSEDECFILNNLSAYISYYKTLPEYNKKSYIPVKVGEVYFNAILLKDTLSCVSYEIANNIILDKYKGLYLSNDNYELLVMPVNLTNDDKERVDKLSNEFKEIKGVNKC